MAFRALQSVVSLMGRFSRSRSSFRVASGVRSTPSWMRSACAGQVGVRPGCGLGPIAPVALRRRRSFQMNDSLTSNASAVSRTSAPPSRSANTRTRKSIE
jgi:hypothetical protein